MCKSNKNFPICVPCRQQTRDVPKQRHKTSSTTKKQTNRKHDRNVQSKIMLVFVLHATFILQSMWDFTF